MSETNPVLAPVNPETIDADISQYEHMPIAQVKKELREHGIESEPTVTAVKRMVETALAARNGSKKKS